MKYDPETECKVLLTVKELGEGSIEEIHEYLEKEEKFEIDRKLLNRILRRWKKKKIIAANYHASKVLWSLADIPPFYISGIMAIVKGTVSGDMRVAMDALDEKLKAQGRIIQPRSVWGNYKRVKLTFETIDPILGGRLGCNDGELEIPQINKERFVPPNWFKGWLGSNAGLLDLPQSIRFRVQVHRGELSEFTPQKYQLKVKTGLCTYEAIPPKTTFTTSWAFPLRGCKLKTLEEWREYIAHISEFPLRGLGANPYALGGRVKLLKFETLD